MLVTCIYALLLVVPVTSLPLYKPSLKEKKVFEIASDNGNYDEENENEMIHFQDLTNSKVDIEDESRYKPLHSYVDSYNKHEAVNKIQNTNAFFRIEPSAWENTVTENEDVPFIAGFKEDLDDVKIFQTKYENFLETIRNKRSNVNKGKNKFIFRKDISEQRTEYNTIETNEEVYDYHKFKKEYDEQMARYINTQKPLNYTNKENVTEESTEVMQDLLDFGNCTELSEKLGMKIIDCLLYKYEQQKKKPRVRKVFLKIWWVIKIWFFMYISFVIPCWCHKGWCCCCFRCKLCFPRKRILLAKQYYANNPPGILSIHSKKKDIQPVKYEPTEFEEDSYEKLETMIRNL